MKTTLLLLMSAAMLVAAPPHIQVAWDPNPPEDQVAGYRLHVGSETGVYTRTITVDGNTTTLKIEDLTAGNTYFIAATAFNAYGLESDYSNELQVLIPPKPAAPGNLRENFQLNLQSSHDLKEWFHVASYQHQIAEPREFWRIQFQR